MRSEQMAWLFDQAGFQVAILTGGYKSYRRFIRNGLTRKVDMIVLGGMTGSGKTETLHALHQKGEQILDLEKMANHKGSVFGALGQEAQPTNEQFENNLFSEWMRFDLSRPVWVENESRMIGNITIPEPFYEQMTQARMVILEVPRDKRLPRVIGEYSRFGKEDLKNAILRISEKLGGTRTQEAILAIDDANLDKAAVIALDYYDKSYQFATSAKTGQVILRLSVDEIDPVSVAEKIIANKRLFNNSI